ncbi:BRCT domain-containing protein [Metarhizium album ARSEF 1941]|uniref:BRCT domain-containing protein n=1 Tax=Metarhizium album (strain ARSEF 1941) TaxID=1081103 RepID=A0A0B2X5Y0_METAS|nr:BRCT domain-containing protein [Metarhizium album ARSEF 1941]KHO01754.1 BRCT domain-containing protein [Metarhizium album ARSEF 1941]
MAAGSGVFVECAVAFVPSNELTPKLIGDLSRVVEENGGTICEPRRNGSIPIEKVTHIVSNTINFEQYVEAQAVMIPVVSEHWISTSIVRRKVAQVRPFSPDPRMIFAEIVVTCADLPQMDKESIIGATMALGGQESKDVTRLTTHVCALSVDAPKVQAALGKGFKGKVVLPHWFDACFKLGKRIDEGPYLLPDPEVMKKSTEDAIKIPSNKNLVGATSVSPAFLPVAADGQSARPPVTVFQDRAVMLGADLNITARLAKAIGDIVVDGGGELVHDVDDCDMYICQYRDGDEYVYAAQSCKEVGSLSWLYSLIVNNQWQNPLHRLLHYPVPRNGIPGFKDLRITISNYGGEARIYLENLVKACGAEFTRTMKADNTHLLTARNSSEKCKAAPEWGVAVINHLWIEESYAKCELRPINMPQYNHFPPRTNLGEIIGQTFLCESRIRGLFYPGGGERVSSSARRKRKILEIAEENAYRRGPAEGVVIGSNSDFDVMRDDEEDAKAPSLKPQKSTAVETPVRSRHARSGKENDTPPTMSTGSRSAKAKARDILQCIAPDIALYEREKKRHSKTGAPWGGKRAADLAEKEKASKTTTSPKHNQEDEEEGPKRPSKKPRPSLPDVQMRLVVTGYTGWVGDSKKEDHDRRKMRALGILIVQEGQACDYLVAPQVVRTVKFLCALARGAAVLSSAFIDKVLEIGEVPEADDFILQDFEAECKYNFKLERSMARAKANRGKLLQGIPIYCTEGVRKGPDGYKSIAEANGATFKLYRARSGTTIRPTTAEEDGFAKPEPVYLLSGNSPEEKQMWGRFRSMAEKGNMEPRIVDPDWLLDVGMAQQVRFDEKFLMEKRNHDESG